MTSKSEETRANQKEYWEKKLAERIALLTEEGAETPAVNKDTIVKMLKAKIRRSRARLRSIAEMAKKVDEKAARKAEKLAAPKPEKPKKKAAADEVSPEESKRQQKKKQKKEKKEGDES